MLIRVSSLELIELLDIDRADVAEEQHQDREPDGRLRGGAGEDEEDEYLPGGIAEETREGDEVEVDGEQHQLDGHEHDEHVAPVEENPDHADREQDRPEDQVMRQRRLRQVRHVAPPWCRRTERRLWFKIR